MLIFFHSFYLIASFLLIHTIITSVSETTEKKCSTDNDCVHQMICNTEMNICLCSKPYFWREDIQTCLGCAPGWIDLETNKCLLYAVSSSSGVTWYQVESICKDLLAHPMLINSINEFQALQHKIQYVLNSENALAATLYFHQGAWVSVNNEWIDSYTWCNNDKKQDDLNCVQIRQNSLTNTICLQYISCSESAQFICEAKPLSRFELEKNIAKSKNSDINNKTEERIIRSSHHAKVKRAPTKTPVIITTKKMINQLIMTTTKKASTWTADHVTSLVNTGMQAAGQIANAVGNIFGKPPSQPASQPAEPQSGYYNNLPQMPQALISNVNVEENSGMITSNMILYGGIGIGILLLIIISIIVCYCCFCSKKKSRSRSRLSIESGASSSS